MGRLAFGQERLARSSGSSGCPVADSHSSEPLTAMDGLFSHLRRHKGPGRGTGKDRRAGAPRCDGQPGWRATCLHRTEPPTAFEPYLPAGAAWPRRSRTLSFPRPLHGRAGPPPAVPPPPPSRPPKLQAQLAPQLGLKAPL